MKCKTLVLTISIFLLLSGMLGAFGGEAITGEEINEDLSGDSLGSGLAPSAWPSFGRDRNNTARSPYNTSHVDGTERWSFETGGNISSSPAICEDGTIYIGSDDNNLYAIYPNGTERWSFETGGPLKSSPAIGEDGTIYVGSNDLYAIHPNGTEKWHFEFEFGDIEYSPAIGEDGTIYVGSDWGLHAVSPEGEEEWNYGAQDDGVRSSPAIGDDGTIYVSTAAAADDEGELHAVYPDGTNRWVFDDMETSLRSSPTIGDDGTIYVGSRDNHLYALDPEDGTEKWSFETGDDVRPSPAIGHDGTIYVGSRDNHLYAIEPDGTEKWSFETGDDVYSSPAIGDDGTIYVGSDDNHLYAINPDGTEKWNFTTGNDVYSSPAIDEKGNIYVGSHDNNLYSIGGEASYFEFDQIENQTAGEPFEITITAYDDGDNVALGYEGTANLTDSTGTIDPKETGAFYDGTWSGEVTITEANKNVEITAIDQEDDTITGTSDEFTVEAGEVDWIEADNVEFDADTGGGDVLVTAYDQYDNLVEGVTIEVDDNDGLNDITPEFDETDADGEVTFTVSETEAGTYEPVFGVADEEISDTAIVTVASGEVASIVADNVTLDADTGEGEVLVTAYDQHDNTVEGVTIEVDDDGALTEITPGSGETDAEGEVTFTVVETEAGTYEPMFGVVGEDITDTAEVIVVSGDVDWIEAEDVIFDADTGEGEVLVTAYDQHGNLVEGVSVEVVNKDGLIEITPGSGDTDAEGEVTFTVSETEAGTYEPMFGVVGGEDITDTAIVTVVSGEVASIVADNVTFDADTGEGEVLVTAYDQHGNLVEGVSVEVVNKDGLIEITPGSGDTDGEGEVTFTVSETEVGTYEPVFGVAGADITDTAIVTVESGEVDWIEAGNVIFDADTGEGEVLVTAYDQHDNTVEGVTIEVVDEDGLTDITPGSGDTDAEGEVTFTVSETEAGTYEPMFGVVGEDITDTAEVIVVSGEVASIVADNVTFDADTGEGEVLVTAYDEDGNPVEGVTIEVVDEDGLTDIDPASGDTDAEGEVTFTVSETEAGTYEPEFDVVGKEITDTAIVTVESGEVASIVADNVTFDADTGEGEVLVIAYDQYDNLVEGVSVEVVNKDGLTEITPEFDETDGDGEFTFTVSETEAGTYEPEFGVENEDLTDTAIVTVEPGEAVNFWIEPKEATVDAGESENYSAWGEDNYGNEFEVTDETNWSDDVDPEDASEWVGNEITVNETGTWVITGEYENENTILTNTSTLNVDPAEAAYFEFEQIGDQVAGEPFEITITAYDEYDNLAMGYEDTAELTDTTGTIDPVKTEAFTEGVWSGLVKITEADENIVITTEAEDIKGTSNEFTVGPGYVDYIEILPENSTITAGETESYSVTAYDEFGNEIADVTEDTNWSDNIDDSEWDQNEITAYTAGENLEITGEYHGFEDTVTLNVEPAGVTQVVIQPERDQTIKARETIDFSAEAYDQYGNLITDDDTEFTWKNTDDTGLFDETEEGEYEVTATYGDVISEPTSVMVEPDEWWMIPGFTTMLVLLAVVIAVAIYHEKKRWNINISE